MNAVALDARAALAFLQREGHAATVVGRFQRRAVRGSVQLEMNVVNADAFAIATAKVDLPRSVVSVMGLHRP